MKARFIFTKAIQCGPDEYVQEYKTVDMDVLDAVERAAVLYELKGIELITESEAGK